ncbi:hypothetical protein HY213_02535 [Candidatus Peregrinibacteria bacterium]|nr:hypothetical protein [Candidatus Peregrinibacteria bacterium]
MLAAHRYTSKEFVIGASILIVFVILLWKAFLPSGNWQASLFGGDGMTSACGPKEGGACGGTCPVGEICSLTTNHESCSCVSMSLLK